MEVWDQLISTAVLGTERQPLALPSQQGPLGAMLARLQGKDAEHMLLAAAAAVNLYRRAGQLPATDESELPAPCEPESLPPCSQRARDVLALIMTDKQNEVLAEWLALATQAGQRVPEDMLPALLETGTQNKWLREKIAPAAGRIGIWLARQNPKWAYLLATAEVDESGWTSEQVEERSAVLAQIREANPARGRALLEAIWSSETPQNRAAFLATFTHGLSMDDEPFLEAALDDKRKEVRTAAAEMLAHLPDSRFAQRMLARLQPLLKFIPGHPARLLPPSPGRKAQIEVILPEACDKAMQRDGIEAKVPPHVHLHLQIGEKAWWLLQMINLIPPGIWGATFGQTPEELIDITGTHEWRQVLHTGWAQAAVRFRDAAWAKTLYPLTLLPNSIKLLNWTELMVLQPPAYWTDVTMKALQGRQSNQEMLLPVLGLIRAYPQDWNETLSTAVLIRIKELLSSPSIFSNHYWTGVGELLHGLLNEFTLKSPSAQLPECTKMIQKALVKMSDEAYRNYLEKVLMSACATMQLRLDMHQAFRPAI